MKMLCYTCLFMRLSPVDNYAIAPAEYSINGTLLCKEHASAIALEAIGRALEFDSNWKLTNAWIVNN